MIITVLVEDLLDELQAGNPRCEEFVGDGVDLRCSEELESQRHVRRCSRSIVATMTTSATATAAGCGPGVTVAMAAWTGTGILATFGSGNSWPCSSSSSGSTGSPSWATGGHRRNRWPGQTQQQNGHGQADQAVGRTGSRAGPEGPKDETDSRSGPGGPGPVSDLPTSPDGPGSDRKNTWPRPGRPDWTGPDYDVPPRPPHHHAVIFEPHYIRSQFGSSVAISAQTSRSL